jgi:hypothetical protein
MVGIGAIPPIWDWLLTDKLHIKQKRLFLFVEIAVFGGILILPQSNSCGNIHKYYALLCAVLCYYIDTE